MAKILLYEGQKRAIENLSSGSILCGGVGSGKSITSLGYFYTKICNGIIKEDGSLINPTNVLDLYIITTARKRDTNEWTEECDRWGLSPLPMFNSVSNTVVIDSWNNIGKFVGVKNAFFIFDEQRLVGSGSWSKSFLKIAKNNKWILLTATPGDTWSDYITVFIANGFYRNRTHFMNEHAIYSRYSNFPKVEKYVNVGRLEKYRRMITVYIDFKRKTESHYLTVKTDYDVSLYKSIMKNRWDVFKEVPIEGVLELCYLLRKVCNTDPSRISKVREILEYHKKVIIFYNFDYELDILRELKDITNVAEWNGHRHEKIPSSDTWVYLVQYTSGAEGWNCIETDTIIFFSQNYSYKLSKQAAGRIDRLNTPFKDLYYYVMSSNSSIDLSIARALKNKKDFNANNFINRSN